MPNKDQIDIKQGKQPYNWLLSFDYNEDFVAYIKRRVPSHHRDFDRDTLVWTIYDSPNDKYMVAIESVAVQKFPHAIKTFYNNEGKLCITNLKTGVTSQV